MPNALPEGFGDANWKEGSSFTSMEGLHDVVIFTAEPVKSNKGKPGFKLTMRINGGPYDGEDLVERFAGITADTIFRTHDVLKAAGVLDTYYKRNEDGTQGGVWIGVPTREELEGLQFRIAVQNQPWQGTDRETKLPAYNQDGTPRMLDSNVVARYYPLGEQVDISTLPPQKPRYQDGVDPSKPFGGQGPQSFGQGQQAQAGGFTPAGGGFTPPAQQQAPQQQGNPWPSQPGVPQQQGGQPGPGQQGW